MKEKFLIFIIGLLLGAVISTGAFCAYTLVSNKTNNNVQMQAPNGNPPSMPSDNNNQNSNNNQNNNQPPEKPSNEPETDMN